MKTKHLLSLRTLFSRFAILLVLMTSFIQQSFAQGSQTFSSAGTFTFTVPIGVTNVRVESWSGGAGGNNTTNRGGGGGAFAGNSALTVTPGSVINITVGTGGNSNAPPNIGGNSSFGSFVIAAGANAENGGLASASTGTAVFSGGNGGTSTNTGGAGGGGSAGAGGVGGNGGNSTNNTGGVGGTAGSAGTGTAGAIGGAGGNSNNSGSNGIAPGSGGGERASNGSTSGVGAIGRVIVTWTCPTATILYPGAPFCKSVTSSQNVTLTGSLGGTFSSVPTGLTINTSTGAITPSTSNTGTYTVHYQIPAAGGCPAINATTAVNVNPVPVATVSSQTNITCFAANDGTITVSASGGNTPYTFSVNDPAIFQPATGTDLRLFTGLLPNSPYRISVKDNNGCISR